MRAFLVIFLLPAAITACSSPPVDNVEWENYKSTYGKSYSSPAADSNARSNYAVNKDKITTHNNRQAKGLELYTLAINQYSDLKFEEFAALFPPTAEIPSNGVPYQLPPTGVVPASFSYKNLGFTSPVQDQKLACNSGWAHAAATAIGIYSAVLTGIQSSVSLSAQYLIDCAGASKACTNQVSQVAFDYLTLYAQRLYPLSQYPYNFYRTQGMCILPMTTAGSVTLQYYSNIPNGNDIVLKSVVSYVAPVVIKFNPGTFEFMHYKAGIFTQPAPTQSAAHYMTVVGYATDPTTGRDYWIVQNSFGETWGELGFIRIERNAAKPITNSAIFPLM